MPILTIAPARARSLDADSPLVIGLVNNMPDAALRATERNFQTVLTAASQDISIHLTLLSLPELPRSAAARMHLTQSYQDIEELWDCRIDGLIVTGAEPRAADLTTEALWATLTKLVDWADDQTSSSIWSCLAAHAAAHYIDGVIRHRLDEKLSGVFDCDVTTRHAIVADAPSRWQVPHSRWNALDETELVQLGYEIISKSAEGGADMFFKQRRSLFMFLQGHPEYDLRALFREYRRDVGRYLLGERDDYPEMPRNYFDEIAAGKLLVFRERTLGRRSIDLLEDFPDISDGQVTRFWQDSAVRVYRNWLLYLLEQRGRSGGRARPSPLEECHSLAEVVA